MNRSTSNKPIYVWIGALLLTNTLPGCAVYRADEKCGWGGCPGDAKITASVRARLAQHPELPSLPEPRLPRFGQQFTLPSQTNYTLTYLLTICFWICWV